MPVVGSPHTVSRRISLSEYVHRRTGLPLGAAGSLRAMLRRAFGSPTLDGFWRYWNPIFGYGLSRYVYGPLRRVLPHGLALLATFLVCGAIHDVVTMLVRRDVALLFSVWFALIAMAILIADWCALTIRSPSAPVRALVHLGVLSATFAVAWDIQRRLIGVLFSTAS